MKNTGNLLVEGMERLGLIAARIRQNEGTIPQIEIDIILQELRNLYMEALQLESENAKAGIVEPDMRAEEVKKQAEAQRKAEEESARRAAEAQRKAEEEAAARRAAEAQRKAEEEAARRAAEAQRKAEEEAARRAAEAQRKAEEEAARKAAEAQRKAEEEAARKAAEAQRKAEEEAARKAAEAQRKAEEEAAARKAAEAQRKAEEEAARKAVAEELKPIFAPEPAEKEPSPVIEPVMEAIEGNRNDELFTDEPVKPAKTAKPKVQESLFDYLKSGNESQQPRVRTLADTLNKPGRNVEEQLENRVNAKKVEDLRTIININDKFSFMSELFHNNMKAYNDFILRLNSYTNREEALAYVSEVATQNMWHENSIVVKSFYKVFDRKF